MPQLLFHLSDEEVDKSFNAYLEAKFPFSYKMKFVADRFGALQRGKTMSYERLSMLPSRFRDTPVYDETLREAMLEKVDIKRVKQIMHEIADGAIKVSTIFRSEKPTPLALHILAKYSDLAELMAPEEMLTSNIDKMKKAIEARTVKLLCMSCMEWMAEEKIRNLEEHPHCGKCGSGLLTTLYRSQNPEEFILLLKNRVAGKELKEEDVKTLTQARRSADLILSYGRKAVIALEVKGVGPETASRILGKMHHKEEDFLMDLLKAKLFYIRSSPYWKGREDEKRRGFSIRKT
jgi:ATP-dependent Lhr-like helicase